MLKGGDAVNIIKTTVVSCVIVRYIYHFSALLSVHHRLLAKRSFFSFCVITAYMHTIGKPSLDLEEAASLSQAGPGLGVVLAGLGAYVHIPWRILASLWP